MKKNIVRVLLLGFVLLVPTLALAEIQINAIKVAAGPQIDGHNSDELWAQAKPVLITDRTANDTILLSAAYTDERIYFLVLYPDKAENILHKPWAWDDEQADYVEAPYREDTFVFKWNMMPQDVDLSNLSDDDYRADVWYWKANRSNPAGYADDKMQIFSGTQGSKSRELVSRTGKKRYLSRISDNGAAPYREARPQKKSARVINRYFPAIPSGSRADVVARGRWGGGFWFIEFSRKLQTGHADDIQFSPDKTALFGVSIFSLYGNKVDTDSPNLYGMGRISEPLRLNFLK